LPSRFCSCPPPASARPQSGGPGRQLLRAWSPRLVADGRAPRARPGVSRPDCRGTPAEDGPSMRAGGCFLGIWSVRVLLAGIFAADPRAIGTSRRPPPA
jgi:hypothetical protein